MTCVHLDFQLTTVKDSIKWFETRSMNTNCASDIRISNLPLYQKMKQPIKMREIQSATLQTVSEKTAEVPVSLEST